MGKRDEETPTWAETRQAIDEGVTNWLWVLTFCAFAIAVFAFMQ